MQLAGDGREWSLRDAAEAIIKSFALTSEEVGQLLPSRTQPIIYNRVGWARTYLSKAGALHQTRRGFFAITERGREILASTPTAITVKYLSQFPEFNAFKSLRHERGEIPERLEEGSSDDASEMTPEEVLESAFNKLQSQLTDDLLENILGASAIFFENLVLDLLVAMGYGGNRRDAAQATKRSGDDGIDGMIKEDRLGLDVIYVQAKRWARDRTVGRPEIQQFAGSLQGNRARKGIFITTAGFSRDAREFVERVDSKIVLVDGPALASLMIENNVGVSNQATYSLKRIDSDYFQED
ncbi:MAG: restriction endonuclease [Proteobacteria bacterium]|nr:restriction endonuclease [Pseudomonadota bacterium]